MARLAFSEDYLSEQILMPACINAVRELLEQNFVQPGRNGILLHSVFHPVVVQTIRKRQTYVHPSRLSTIDPVSKQELLLEIVFLGTEHEHDTYQESSAYRAAWNGGFAGARKESTLRQADDSNAPLLIFPSGFPLELFDSVRHCLLHPRRHNSFEGPSVTVIHNIIPSALAEDVLAVLSRSHTNQAALAGIRQAVVV